MEGGRLLVPCMVSIAGANWFSISRFLTLSRVAANCNLA